MHIYKINGLHMWFFAGLIPISDVIKKRLAVVEK